MEHLLSSLHEAVSTSAIMALKDKKLVCYRVK